MRYGERWQISDRSFYIYHQRIALIRHGMQWEGIIPNATEGKHHITVIPFRGKPVQLEIEFFGMGFNSSLDLDDF